MKWLALTIVMTINTMAFAVDKPKGKRHEYQGLTLTTAPMGAKPDWKPSARVKLNDSISVLYPTDIKEMELFECSSDNNDVRVSIGIDEKGKGIRVGIRSGNRINGGKKATAHVSWTIIDFRGLEQRGNLDVVFE